MIIWREKRFDYVAKWLDIEKLEYTPLDDNGINNDQKESLRRFQTFANNINRIQDTKVNIN